MFMLLYITSTNSKTVDLLVFVLGVDHIIQNVLQEHIVHKFIEIVLEVIPYQIFAFHFILPLQHI